MRLNGTGGTDAVSKDCAAIVKFAAGALRRGTRALPLECLADLSRMSYAVCMKTLTIRLPDSLLRELETESEARRVSKSDIVRERLAQSGASSRPPGKTWDRVKDILQQSWNTKEPGHGRRFYSPKKQKLAKIIRGKKLHR